MNEKNAAIYGSVFASVGIGIIALPIVGPVVLTFPVIAGVLSKILANSSIPEGNNDSQKRIQSRPGNSHEQDGYLENLPATSLGEAVSSYVRNSQSAKLRHDFKEDSDDDEEPRRERRINTRRNHPKRQGGLKGARGTPDNEAYLRRRGRRV